MKAFLLINPLPGFLLPSLFIFFFLCGVYRETLGCCFCRSSIIVIIIIPRSENAAHKLCHLYISLLSPTHITPTRRTYIRFFSLSHRKRTTAHPLLPSLCLGWVGVCEWWWGAHNSILNDDDGATSTSSPSSTCGVDRKDSGEGWGCGWRMAYTRSLFLVQSPPSNAAPRASLHLLSFPSPVLDRGKACSEGEGDGA